MILLVLLLLGSTVTGENECALLFLFLDFFKRFLTFFNMILKCVILFGVV